jgi:ribonucleoside-diphosphate reductase alpha chain
MDISRQILSDVTIYSKYARYLPERGRRETWEEIVARNADMHKRRFPALEAEINNAYDLVYSRKVLPSMRSMQFAGAPIELNPARSYNCSYLPIDHWKAFSEVMFLLLGGTGVGYSVQFHHVRKLPEIRRNCRTRRFLVGDSIEGWADAVKVLLKAYFFGAAMPEFDFGGVRPRGTPLRTAGGLAPGPEPLRDCLHNLRKVLDRAEIGTNLRPIQVHDMLCHIADAVLAGGIRRSAMISLFSFDDDEMLTSKFGSWWELNPQRARAGNSAVILRHRVRRSDFELLWEKIEASKSGEPGIFFSNDSSYGTNPCGEVGLRANQMCNLTEIDASTVSSQEELSVRARAAGFIGTIQAAYTQFHYLRPIWQEQCEKDALIGVGMTGVATGGVLALDLERAALLVGAANSSVAHNIDIRSAARTTLVKPSGTTSLVLGCSSGIHPWHAPFYLRRMRVLTNEPLYTYLFKQHPYLVEPDYFKPQREAVISIPIAAPDGAIFRSEPAMLFLERIQDVNTRWVKPGHWSGHNSHNISATVSVKEDEWKGVGQWMWEHRHDYTGLSVLPYDGGVYKQPPHEEVTEAEYTRRLHELREFDISAVTEYEDRTTRQQEEACANGQCSIESPLQSAV